MTGPLFKAEDFDCLGIGLGCSPSEENIASIANERLASMMKCPTNNLFHVANDEMKCRFCGSPVVLIAERGDG